jgi:PKD repeat protein
MENHTTTEELAIQNPCLGRSLTWLLCLSVALLFSTPIGAATLGLYYSFDADEGPIVSDLSGNNQTGTVHGATYSTNGISGGAYRFAESNWITAGNILDLSTNVIPSLTVSAWIRSDDAFTGDGIRFVCKQEWHSPYSGWSLSTKNKDSKTWHAGRAQITATWPQQVAADSTTRVDDTQWHHLCGVFTVTSTSLETKIYCDGILEQESIDSGLHGHTSNDAELWIGARYPGAASQFKGLIDEVRIYEGALTAVEVHTLFTNTQSTTYELNASAGPGGTIMPSGIVHVVASGNQTFSIEPDDGFEITNLVVDGESITPTNNYTFSNVTSNHSIEAWFGSATPTGIADGTLVLYYPFAADHETVAIDHSGYSNHGSVVGASFVSNGFVNGAYHFAASNWISIGDKLDLGEAAFTAITVSIWLKADETFTENGIRFVSKQEWENPYTGWSLSSMNKDDWAWHAGRAQITATWPEQTTADTTTRVDDTSWHHLCGVFRVSSTTLQTEVYLDGNLNAAETRTGDHGPTENEGELWVGSRYPGIGGQFEGTIDEVRIYAGALSSADIMDLFTNTLSDFYTITASAGPGGTISPSGTFYIAAGSNQTFTTTAHEGYQLTNLLVNGTTVSLTNTYTFASIFSNHMIEAQFGEIPPQLVTEQAMLLYYPFDANNGAVAVDQSGYSNHGTIVGATFVSNSFGGGAYRLGTDDWINVGSKFDLGTSAYTVLTVSAWIKSDAAFSEEGIRFVSKQEWDVPYTGWSLSSKGKDGRSWNAGRAQITATWPEQTTADTTTRVDDTVWHHMCGIFEVGTTSLHTWIYCDGVLEAENVRNGAHGPVENDGELWIGSRYPGLGGQFKGIVDEVRIFNYALSPQQVANLHTGETASGHFISCSSGTGGSVEPSGQVFVEDGGNLAVTIEPDTGFAISNIVIDGTAAEPTNHYIFSSVASNHSLHASFAYTGAVTTVSNLSLYYSFGDDNGDFVVDESGNGHIGSVHGADYMEEGYCGGAYAFSRGDWIDVGPVFGLEGEYTTLTVCAWVKGYDLFEDGIRFVNKQDAESPYTGWSLSTKTKDSRTWQAARAQITATWPQQSAADSTTRVDDAEWHHLCGIYHVSATSMETKIYVDGVLEDVNVRAGTHGPTSTDDSLWLGLRSGSTDGDPFIGVLDEIRIYRGELPPEQISELYLSDATNCNRQPGISLNAAPVTGPAPLQVTFDFGNSYNPGGIIERCELDRTGDGVYETRIDGIGAVTVTYKRPGTYAAYGRIMDAQAELDATSVVITVVGNNPSAALLASPASGTAPLAATLSATGSAAGVGRTLALFEWDVDGDGITDAVTTNAQHIHTYGKAGDYEAMVNVYDDIGARGSTSTVVSVTAPSSPPAVELALDPSAGHIPLDVTLSATASGPNAITDFGWDFDGDGETDTHTTSNSTTHTYVDAGFYRPAVRVVDSEGLSAQAWALLLLTRSSRLKVWIVAPRDGASIWGDSVTLHANTAPGNLTQDCRFEYRALGDETWLAASAVITPPPYSFKTTWDVTGLNAGTYYELRAVATDTADTEVKSEILTVLVDEDALNHGKGHVEQTIQGTHTVAQKLNRDVKERVSVADGVSASVPPRTMESETVIRIRTVGANTNGLNGSARGQTCIDMNRAVKMDLDADMAKPILLSIPYPDTDNDGWVDGTTIHESTLRGHYFDETEQVWKRTMDSELHPDENFVKSRLYAEGEIGLFGNENLLLAENGGSLTDGPTGASSAKLADRATDGDWDSFWESEASPSGTQTFNYVFKTNMTAVIDSVGIQVADTFTNITLTCQFEATIDGISYWPLTNITLSATDGLSILSFSPQPVRGVRLRVSSGDTDPAWALSEVAVYGNLTNDGDGDGMNDSEELKYFLSLDEDYAGDYDNDGVTNDEELDRSLDPTDPDSDDDGQDDGEETIAGTEANNADSYFLMDESAVAPPRDVVVWWQSRTGRVYKIHRANDFDGGTWTSVYEVTGTGNTLGFTNSSDAAERGYIRLTVEREEP